MPTSVHRVLAHGEMFMKTLPLPLGKLSEEAAEAQNKYLRRDREMLARKINRIDNLTDIFNRRLICSDPNILHRYTKARAKKTRKLLTDEDSEEYESDEEHDDSNEISNTTDEENCENDDEFEYYESEQDCED